MNEKIKYKDLSLVLKIGFEGGILALVAILAIIIGFAFA